MRARRPRTESATRLRSCASTRTGRAGGAGMLGAGMLAATNTVTDDMAISAS
jgi:hypothetical protein